MAKIYKKPIVSIDTGLSEGVYAASGATQGSLNVSYIGIWDRWSSGGGKGLAQLDWSNLNGTVTVTVTFNDTVDQVEYATSVDGATCSASGSNAILTFNTSNAPSSIMFGVHINHGTSIDNLNITGFTYSVH